MFYILYYMIVKVKVFLLIGFNGLLFKKICVNFNWNCTLYWEEARVEYSHMPEMVTVCY